MKSIIFFFLPFLLLHCNKNELPVNSNCDKVTVVSDSRFENAPRDDFDFVSAEIEGDCLEVAVRYGGGCGGAKFELIGNNVLKESLPLQRFVVISFDDKDNCEALIIKTLSFDLTPLQVGNTNEVAIRINGISRTSLLYRY